MSHCDQDGALTPRAQDTIDSLMLPTGREGLELGPYPGEDGKGVPGVGISEGQDTKHLTEPGLLDLKKPKSGKERGEK